jgi:hypothetical protein
MDQLIQLLLNYISVSKNFHFMLLIKFQKCFYALLPLILTVVFFSCSKNKYPGAKIVSPANGQTFIAPEVVTVTAELYDDGDALTSQYLFVINQNGSNDTVVNVKQHDFLFGKYVLTRSFPSKSNTTYKIVAYARGGHGNSKTDSILVKTN